MKVITKTWNRPKFPFEDDVRYARFDNDLEPGDSVASIIDIERVSGDIDASSFSLQGNVVGFRVTGGTMDTIFLVKVLTANGLRIGGRGILMMAG